MGAASAERLAGMSYISFSYYVFIILLAVLYYVLPKKIRWLVLLLGSGCFYYLLVDQRRRLLLFAGSILVSYLWGRLLGKQCKEGKASPRKRKLALLGGILLSCGPLLGFRLADFFPGRVPGGSFLATMMPIGLAFYSMQMIAYLADIYRGEIEPEKHLLKYSLFVSFFPLIIQGPISRFRQLEHQLIEGHSFDWGNIMGGIQLIIWGFFLKFMIADRAAVIVNEVFDHARFYSGIFVLVAAVLYSIQLYTDFLSCVTLSQGAARLFGIEVIDNFNHPYFASSIREFWRRWHMSLSSWLRDYVYIPLGGNRKGKGAKYCNLAVTFAVSGLWHGGGWNYLCWGLLHAVYQITGELTLKFRNACFEKAGLPGSSKIRKFIEVWVTFFLVTMGWILFRAENLGTGLRMIGSMLGTCNPWVLFDDSLFRMGLGQKEWEVLFLSLLVLFLVSYAQERGVKLCAWFERQNLVIRWSIYFGAIWSIWIFGTYGFGFSAQDFIYGGF